MGRVPCDNHTMMLGFDNDVCRTTAVMPLQDRPGVSSTANFGSAHPSLCIFVFCDGSVHKLSLSIDAATFANLGSRNDGKPISRLEAVVDPSPFPKSYRLAMKPCRPARREILVLVVGLGLLGQAGCGGSRVTAVLPPRIASDAAKKAMETYDVDKNGYLDTRELEKVPALQVAFPGASQVTEQDIADRIAWWKETKFGRMVFVGHREAQRPAPAGRHRQDGARKLPWQRT